MRAIRVKRGPGPTVVLLLPLVAIAALAAGCGGGSGKAATSSPTTSTTVPGNRSAARARFTQCLESHGVPTSVAGSFGGFRRGSGTAGTGEATPTSVPAASRPTVPSQYSAAFAACRSLLPSGPLGGGLLNNPADAAYRNCLQVHGVTLPSTPPSTAAGTSSTAAGSSVPAGSGRGGGFADNPTFRAAAQACASLLPAGQTGPGGSTPGSTPSA